MFVRIVILHVPHVMELVNKIVQHVQATSTTTLEHVYPHVPLVITLTLNNRYVLYAKIIVTNVPMAHPPHVHHVRVDTLVT